LGGIGPCGRMLCCSTFLGDFEPVSIKMAKDQNLSLNPAKISGLCGRLMCCLKYENDHYEDAKRKMSAIVAEVKTEYGQGKLVGLNILDTLVQIELYEEETVIEYTLDELIHEEIITVPVTEYRMMLLNKREMYDQVTHMETQIVEIYEKLFS